MSHDRAPVSRSACQDRSGQAGASSAASARSARRGASGTGASEEVTVGVSLGGRHEAIVATAVRNGSGLVVGVGGGADHHTSTLFGRANGNRDSVTFGVPSAAR